MGSSLHNKALALRKKGWSYNIISERLGVNKSTLSGWLKDAPYEPNAAVLKRIKSGPRISGEKRRAKRMARVTEANQSAAREVGTLSDRDLLMLGIGLYIGEGVKVGSQTRIVNADPNVIRTAMKWFRDVCRVPNENFRITLHIYPDTSEAKAKAYWSKVTGLPKSQYYQTFTDLRVTKRINQGKLPFGTAHVTVNAYGKPELASTLHKRILGLINAVYEQINAGIV